MTGDDSPAPGRGAASGWWTPKRTRLAGLGSAVGGLVGLASLGLGSLAVDGGGIEVGLVGGVVRTLHPVVYVPLAVAVLAADARFGSGYGRRGRGVATLFALSLAGYAGSVGVLVAGRLAFVEIALPVGGLVGTAYLAMRLFGSLYGIALWRHADANRLTAGLLAVLFPAIFVLGPLTVVGFPATWLESPIYLAFVALGYDLWTGGMDAAGGGTEVSG